MTTHYHPMAKNGMRILFCSGMAVMYAMQTNNLDAVTCKACRRKLIAQAKKAS